MNNSIQEEYKKTLKKRDEIREALRKLEREDPSDSYTIAVTRDRLAYWEGKTEGLKFAVEHFGKE